MRVLFLNPPVVPTGAVAPPLAIATLVAWITPVCEDLRLFDGDLLFFDRSQRSRTILFARFLAELEEFQPELLLVTSMYNNSALAASLIEAAKAANPALITVGGGPHFGAQPDEALKAVKALDFVIAGEGEVGLRSLVEALGAGRSLEEVPNLAWRSEAGVRVNERAPLLDLALLPNVWAASAKSIDISAYARTIADDSPRRSLYMEAGRGCPFACNFCAPAQFWNRRYRVKTPAQIAAEIRYLHEVHRYDAFILVHDLLTVDDRFVRALTDALTGLKLPIRWMANSRTDLKHARDFDHLAESGCWRLFYGVDSASPRIQREMEKGLDPEESLRVIAEAVSHGLGTVCSFVIGHRSETDAELSESLILGTRLKAIGAENVQFHRLRLFPPAPLASGARLDELLGQSALDRTTLGLEYPLPEIAEEERTFIEAHPRFYAGYFPPPSTAGSPEEISQIELFFTQAVAFAPLTIFALGRLGRTNLVRQFRAHLERYGMIDRAVFDPSELNIVRNWAALRQRLETMIEEAELDERQHKIVTALLSYEDSRMLFVHEQPAPSGAVLWQHSQAVTQHDVGVDRVLDAVIAGTDPDPDMLERVTVIFSRETDNVVVAR